MAHVRKFTLQQREKQLAAMTRADEGRKAILKQLAVEKMSQSHQNIEAMSEERRYNRMIEMERRECELQENIIQAERNRIAYEQQVEQEERLAQELKRRNLEKTRDEKMRQQIRENSMEIRELEEKLKAAYLNKARAGQIAEKEAMRLQQLKADAIIIREMDEELQKAKCKEQLKEEERLKLKMVYQDDLDRQLQEQEQRKQQAYEDFLHEKHMIDEIVRKILDEDQKEHERQMARQQETQAYIQEFLEAREVWKEQERLKIEEENKKIIEYAHLQNERQHQQKQQKAEREAILSKTHEVLSEQIARDGREREELEKIRMELCLEEQEEKTRQEEMAALEKKLRARIELQRINEQQLALRAAQKKAQEEEERRFRELMMAKFAEDDRLEQMNAQKRRMKQLEHGREVERIIEERRVKRVREKHEEDAIQRDLRQLEELKKAIIEEERQKLLKEHAQNLIGYLPKGVIQSEKDLDLLGEDFKKVYSKRERDPFDEEY